MKGNLKARSLSGDSNAMWDMIIGAAFAIIFIVTALYIGTFIQGTVGTSIVNNIPVGTDGSVHSQFLNRTLNTTYGISTYWDTDVGMLNIALVITIITIPLMVLVYVRKIM